MITKKSKSIFHQSNIHQIKFQHILSSIENKVLLVEINLINNYLNLYDLNYSTVYISFGGLLMSIQGKKEDLVMLEMDSRIYLLLKEV